MIRCRKKRRFDGLERFIPAVRRCQLRVHEMSILTRLTLVGFTPDSDQTADIERGRARAHKRTLRPRQSTAQGAIEPD